MSQKNSFKKRLPIIFIALIAIVGAITLKDLLSFETLAFHRETLLSIKDEYFILSSLAFIAIYTLIVGFSLPGAAIATLTGGFLFGVFPGTLYNVAGATLGAIAVFLAAKAGFGAEVAQKIERDGGAVAKLQAALRENEWSALLIMRLVPAVPFFIANLLPAFVGTSLSRFAITTFVGIIPGTLVFTSVGSGLGDIFERGEKPDLSIIFAPHILLPILGLSALSALPIILKRFKKG